MFVRKHFRLAAAITLPLHRWQSAFESRDRASRGTKRERIANFCGERLCITSGAEAIESQANLTRPEFCVNLTRISGTTVRGIVCVSRRLCCCKCLILCCVMTFSFLRYIVRFKHIQCFHGDTMLTTTPTTSTNTL